MIYSEIIKSKDGFDIPLFKSKKLVHSKYSPINESKNFGNDINKNSLFTIILGLGGGYHIKNFLEKNQNQFILVIENSIEDILFLSQIECVKNLLNKKNVLIISKEKVYESLVNNYLPHIFGGINILSLRTWIDENSNFQSQTSQNENSINKKYINENSNFEKHNNVDFILKEINDCIKFISSDFSVQCHFGNIWQKNIFSNLLIAQKNQLKLFQNKLNNKNFETQQNTFFNFQTKKVAAIIAAGPSLDFTISKIKKNRDNYFIIATDTAISILIKNDLTFDAAISIDGQNVSYKHFIGLQKYINEKKFSPTFIFDLQSNYCAVNYVSNFSDKIIFTKSGHPLCNYLEKKFLKTTNDNLIKIPTVETGAGTVTIAAIDFANKIGFNNFEIFGADFSYLFNKPYAKGTYLDYLYRFDFNENKIKPAENNFTNLLFRTPIKKNKINSNNFETTQIKTEILNSYKDTFLNWIQKNNLNYSYNDFVYKISKKSNNQNIEKLEFNFFEKVNFKTFQKIFKDEINSEIIKIENEFLKIQTQNQSEKKFILKNELTSIEISLLPFIAFLKNKNQNLGFYESLKLALTKILQYNFIL